MTRVRLAVAGILAVVVGLVAAAGVVALVDRDPSPRPAAAGGGGVVQPLADATRAPGARSWTPWPEALHDAAHTGASDVVGPQTGHVRWHVDLGADVTPGPVIAADGTVYAATDGGVLFALDPATGRTVWRLDGGAAYGNDLSTSPAVLPSGLILWPGPQDDLVAVSPTGTVRWRLPFDETPTSPAVTADGDVVVGDTGGAIVALHPDDDGPHVRWRYSAGESSFGSVVLSADGRTAYDTTISGVVAVRDGTLLWRAEPTTETIEVSAAVAPDGTIAVGANGDDEFGLDPADGHTVWTYDKGYTTYSSPSATLDGLVWFGDHHDRITALDAHTGERRFEYQGDRSDTGPGGIGIWTSILVDADHDVYAGTRQGYVYGVDARGRLLWSLRAPATVDSYPALGADGTLFVGTTDGQLWAVGDAAS